MRQQSERPATHGRRSRADAGTRQSGRVARELPEQAKPVLSIQHTAGNQAACALVRRMRDGSGLVRESDPPETATAHRVRRMVAVASENYRNETDLLVLNNLQYALDRFKGPVGDFTANRNFRTTKPGDRVGIIAHGAPGQIGEKPYKATDVADALTDARDPIDKGVTSIVLYSCNAGMEQQNADPSLVEELSRALASKGFEIGVEGLKGIGFGFAGIGERTTRGTESEGDDAWFQTRDRLLKESEYQSWEVSPGNGFVDGDTLLRVAGGKEVAEVQKMSVEEKAAAISKILAPFWQRVDKEMGTKLYPHLKGWLRVMTYASGGKLDTIIQDSR